MREHLLDRFAIAISADVKLTMEQRLEAVNIATLFQNSPQQLIDDSGEVTDATKTQVILSHSPILAQSSPIDLDCEGDLERSHNH